MNKTASYFQYLRSYQPAVLRKYQSGLHGVLGRK